jgi:hypothetical protein
LPTVLPTWVLDELDPTDAYKANELCAALRGDALRRVVAPPCLRHGWDLQPCRCEPQYDEEPCRCEPQYDDEPCRCERQCDEDKRTPPQLRNRFSHTLAACLKDRNLTEEQLRIVIETTSEPSTEHFDAVVAAARECSNPPTAAELRDVVDAITAEGCGPLDPELLREAEAAVRRAVLLVSSRVRCVHTTRTKQQLL